MACSGEWNVFTRTCDHWKHYRHIMFPLSTYGPRSTANPMKPTRTQRGAAAMSARGRAKRGYHHGDLRKALIDAALEQIAAHGAHTLSLREVARLAGVSHTASYRHFSRKETLLAAIATEGF